MLVRLRRAFSDIQYRVDDAIVTGDRAVIRWETRGTHQGEYLGVPATGRAVSYSGITLFELRDGRIARAWVAADLLSLLRRACRKGERRRLLSRPHDSHASRSGCAGISTAEEGVESKERPPHLLRRADAPIALAAQKKPFGGGARYRPPSMSTPGVSPLVDFSSHPSRGSAR